MKRNAVMLVVIAALLSGCGTIYTTREYGPQAFRIVLTKGLTFEEALSKLGEPDTIHEVGNGVRIAAYRSVTYRNILGIYATTETSDYVLTFVNGRLTEENWINTGEDVSIFAMQTFTLGLDPGH